ncbi:hypothetical protein [Foetidibacter luteolus]|uniref:hypothetical protein n=1 Tax=Foetidibacter luteolus TaxID=2608880 RepID=UPI00129BDF23|nr:hypothetical protein [Foetidibacter luteolus]
MHHKLCYLFACLFFVNALAAQNTCLNASRVEVLPVFFVPQNVAFPDAADQKSRIQQHLLWAQKRFKEMLGNRSTFSIADTGSITYFGKRQDSYYKAQPDRGAAAYLEELLPYIGYTRFNCPYVILVIYIDYNYNFPLAGGRTLNGGINSGGGVIIMSGADLKFSAIFQSTLQHELGHGFSLPHIDSYGYDMNSNASIMSYNLTHQTNFFEPSPTPGILIAEDIRNLSLNNLALPDLEFDSTKDIPAGYNIYPHVPLVGIMDIPGQPPYRITVTTTSGETYGSAAGNLVQNEIKLSYPGMPFAYDQQNMWHSGEVPGWATVTIKFPVTVTLDKVGLHTQHSGIYQKADSVRIDRYNNNNFTRVLERPLPGVDEYIAFAPVTDSVFRFHFKPGTSKMVTIRGIEFFNNNEVVFPPAVPYALRDPQRKLLPSKTALNAPADSSIINAFTTQLSWGGLRSAMYKLQIDTCKDFCQPITETIVTNTSFTYNVPVAGKKYYWRVKGLNNTEQGFGEWSNIRHFVHKAVSVYYFTGNGSYFTASNWQNNAMPPNPVTAGIEVRIISGAGKECLVDKAVTFANGSKLTITANTKLKLGENLVVK